MYSKPLVSLITVNYNSVSHTLELLESVEQLSYSNLEVFVVDNGSEEDPRSEILKYYPAVKYIRSEVNLGFAGGNNLAVNKANGKFIYFVNNDTCLKSNVLDVLIERFKKSPEFGVLSTKIIYYGTDNILQYAGYTKMNLFTARNRLIGNGEKDRGQYDSFKEVAYPHGASMIVKREILEKVGPIPEQYFLYYEEFDWAESIKKAGFKIGFEPKSIIYHKEAMSVGKLTPLRAYYMNRNRILFINRNVRFYNRILFIFFYTFFSLPKNLIFAHTMSLRKSILKGYLDSFSTKGGKVKNYSFGKINGQ